MEAKELNQSIPLDENEESTSTEEAVTQPHSVASGNSKNVSDTKIQRQDKVKPLSRDDSQALSRILAQLRDKTGHDFTYYKRSTILRRIERRMQVSRIESIAEYLGYLRQNPEETQALFKDFLISVTNFFRDPDAFAVLEKQVISKMFENKGKDHPVRVWTPGCATGEEAYSIAILLHEYAAELNEPPSIHVFATDIDEEGLIFAREGLYLETVAADLTPERLKRFFVEEAGGYRIKKEIREMVLFAKHNLLKDPAFSRLDLISCRNLLIYLNREVQNKVFELFHYALHPGGYLFLGSAEAASIDSHLFATQDKKYRLFQRRDVAIAPRFIGIPLVSPDDKAVGPLEPKPERKAHTLEEIYQAWTLKRYTPPRLIVNENYNITHIFSGAGKYLHEEEGPLTQNILERVLPGFRVDLRTALHQAFQRGERTTSRWLRLEVGGEPCVVRLQVGPIDEPNFPAGYVEIVFEENQEVILHHLEAKVQAENAENVLVARLEEELQRTKERLQTTIEEQETANEEMRASNEELQSMNEELRSTTEELETSKEELQSINEELITVNQELKTKVEELSQANSDLQNLIISTDIGTIFLDRKLNIKRYTPRLTELFKIIPSDVGRPFDHISHQLNDNNLLKDAKRVLDKLTLVEREVQGQNGHWYIMRILPYRTIEDKIDGVIITFVDITSLKRIEQELNRRVRQQATVAHLGQLALAGMELDRFMQQAAQQVAEKLNVEYCKVLELLPDKESFLLKAGVGWKEGYVGQAIVDADRAQAGYTLEAEGPVIVEDLAKEPRFQAPTLLLEHNVVSGMSVIISGLRAPYGVLGAHTSRKHHFTTDDINFLQAVANLLAEAIERKQVEAQLRRSEAQIRQQLAELQTVYRSAPVGLAVLDTDLRYLRINDYLAQINGRSAAEHMGQTIHDVIPDLAGKIEPLFRQAIETGQPVIGVELHGIRSGQPDIEQVWLESCYPLQTGEGQIVGINVVVQDITENKRAEVALQESEARFRHLADAMPQIVWANDPAGKVEFLNQRWLDYTGLTFEESVTAGIMQVVHPDDLARARIAWAEQARQGQAYTDELRLRGVDGTYRWYLVRSVPIWDQEGNIRQWIGTSTDINERKKAEQRLAAEHGISQVLAKSESLDEAGTPILEVFCNNLEVDICELWLPNEAKTHLVRTSYFANNRFDRVDEFNAVTDQIIFKPGMGMPGRVWQSKKPLWVTDITDEPSLVRSKMAAQFGLIASFGFPILSDDECLGVITFFSAQPMMSDEPLLEMMAAVARDIEQFIQRTQAEQQLRQHTHVLEILNQVNTSLAAELDLERLLQAVTNATTELSGAQFGAFFYNVENSQGESYMLYTLAGAPRQAFENFPMPRNTEIFGPTFRGEAIIRLDDVTQDPRYGKSSPYYGMPKDHLPVRSYLALPVILRSGEVIGGLFFGHSEPGVFTEQAEQLVAGVAAQAAIAIDNARLYNDLRESEERYRLAARATNDAIWDHDLQSGRVEWNQAIETLFGYHEGLSGTTSNWWQEHLHPDDRERAAESLEAARTGGEERWINEYRFLRADGSYADVLDRGFVIRDEHGQAVRMIGAMLDLTEHRRIEQALRESEARFRGTFDNAAVGMGHVDLQGRMLRVNQRLCDISGYTEAELLQKTFQEITHPDDLAADLEQFDSLIQGQISSYQMEKRYIRKNGETIWINLTVSLQRNVAGTPLYCISVIEDIAERKHAEDQLRFLAEASTLLASSLDYETTLQRVAGLIVPHLADWYAVDILGPGGNLELLAVGHVDPAKVVWARELRQHRPTDMNAPTGTPNVIRTGQSEFYPEIPEELLAAAAVDEETAAILRQVSFKSVIIVPLKAREQVFGAMTLVWSDTDRRYDESDLKFAEELAWRAATAIDNARLYREAREAEAELRAINEHLEQRVAARTIELERRNQELDQFAYVASHDLKAPLRAIDNLATWITEDAGEVLAEPSKRHLRTMRGRVKRMEELLNDLLTYSRADRLDNKVVTLDTEALVKDVIELLAPPPTFSIIVEAGLPTILAARTPLEIIFRNLIDNAIKHHHRPDGQVRISARDLGEIIEFSVADDGPGIDELFHERIFQMFQTLQSRDKVEGSGMGLAVVKKIVDGQGETISLDSAEDRGSTFRFTWPKAPKIAQV